MKAKIIQSILARFERVSESQEKALSDYFDSALENLRDYSRVSINETTEKRPFKGRESALASTLESACFDFLCKRTARTIAQAMVERFQDRREGITRKATGAQNAQGRNLYAYRVSLSQSVLWSGVPLSTLEDMEGGALGAIGAHFAENPILDSAGIFSACRSARLILNRHQRNHRRESDLESDESERESAMLATYAEINAELSGARALAIQESAEKMKLALVAYWQNSGSRKAKSGLASECAVIDQALAVALESESADSWNARQRSRTALYERLRAMREHASAGLALLGQRPDTLRALYGERAMDESEHKQASADCARIMPIAIPLAPLAPQKAIGSLITRADLVERSTNRAPLPDFSAWQFVSIRNAKRPDTSRASLHVGTLPAMDIDARPIESV